MTVLRDVTDMTSLCSRDDLIENAGVCALYNDEQLAIFYLPDSEQKVYALNNHDPFSGANVLSRGIVGSLGDTTVVASPIYKQHFDLLTGTCIEDAEVKIKTYPVDLVDDQVMIRV